METDIPDQINRDITDINKREQDAIKQIKEMETKFAKEEAPLLRIREECRELKWRLKLLLEAIENPTATVFLDEKDQELLKTYGIDKYYTLEKSCKVTLVPKKL